MSKKARSIRCNNLSGRGDVVPLGRREVVLAGLDLLVKLLEVVVPEGRVASQEDVHDHTRGPDVNLFPVWHAAAHFRRKVPRCASKPCAVSNQRTGAVQPAHTKERRAFVDDDCETEIRELHRCVRRAVRKKQVLRLFRCQLTSVSLPRQWLVHTHLQVAVNDVLLVADFEAGQDLEDSGACVLLVVVRSRDNLFKELAARNQLCV